jgi:hypothetical protein
VTAVATERVAQILAGARIDGTRLVIPEQLSRADYVAVNQVLTALGGQWSRRDHAHVFPDDPSAQVAAVVSGAAMPPPARTAEGYVPTPLEVAEEVVREHTRLADLDAPRVLEPSAGDGALVDAIRVTAPDATVVAVEPNADRAADLGTWPGVTLVPSTFEEYAAQTTDRFDAVVMNPPFSVPGHPTIWIDHVRLAWRLLDPGGRLTAIVPNGYTFRNDRRHTAIRELIEHAGGQHAALTEEAFGRRGIRTVVVWVDKPLDYTEPAPPSRKRGRYQATPEEIADRRASDRELAHLVNGMLDDPAAVARMQATLSASGASPKILGYSPRNQALLLAQCQARGIQLVDVDSPGGWRKRGRTLRRDVVGLRIVAPRGKTTDTPDTAEAPGIDPAPDGRDEHESVLFRMISVFEFSQTEPLTDSTGQAVPARRGWAA